MSSARIAVRSFFIYGPGKAESGESTGISAEISMIFR